MNGISTLVAIAVMIVPFAFSAPSAQAGAKKAKKWEARADLKDAKGSQVGTVLFVPGDGGNVQVHVKVSGLEPGLHGFHIHEKGSCKAPDFKSAGGHFDPKGHQHGLENPKGAHAGDFPNLKVGKDGNANQKFTTDRISLKEGEPASVFKKGGTAVVVHAGKDDQKTNPAGDAGARVACGVITKPKR